MISIFISIWTWALFYLRLLIKWILRRTTGLCELQRTCYGEISGTPRIAGVEQSLNQSRDPEIRKLITNLNRTSENKQLKGATERDILETAIYTVIRVKNINPQVHPRFPILFGKCVEQIWGYKQLYHEVEELRTTTYDCNNPDHEAKLLQLWKLLKPEEDLDARISKKWQDIGFQGDDPKTDFRGMGLLGLENLIYFAEEFPGPSKHVLSHSHHPSYGYAFAIVGINLTSMAYRLLKDGSLKTHVYNYSKSLPTMRIFHQVYCYLFYEFDKYWIESIPKSIMDFSRIHDQFEQNIRQALTNPLTFFKINVSIENV